MNLYAHRNMNFHTEEVPGGLVFCPAGVTTKVPDDVKDEKLNPLFQKIVDAGYVTVLGEGKAGERGPVINGGPPGPTGQPAHAPDDENENVERKEPGEEDELGPPVSQADYELRTPLKSAEPKSDKPATQPAKQHEQPRQEQTRQEPAKEKK